MARDVIERDRDRAVYPKPQGVLRKIAGTVWGNLRLRGWWDSGSAVLEAEERFMDRTISHQRTRAKLNDLPQTLDVDRMGRHKEWMREKVAYEQEREQFNKYVNASQGTRAEQSFAEQIRQLREEQAEEILVIQEMEAETDEAKKQQQRDIDRVRSHYERLITKLQRQR